MSKRIDDRTLRQLDAVPKIPFEHDCWGKEYTNGCPCGGTITAIRSTLNGHLCAKCDKCNFVLFE